MRYIIYTFLTLIFLTLTCCFGDPPQQPLPTPTAGLTAIEQEINHTLLTQGEIRDRAELFGQAYTVRQHGIILGLYNDQDHAIAIFLCPKEDSRFELKHFVEPLPCPIFSVNRVYLDGRVYSLVGLDCGDAALVLIFDYERHQIFGVSEPSDVAYPGRDNRM